MINIMFNVIGKRNNQTPVADADRKSQTSGEREMPEMRFTEFPAFPVCPRVGFFGLHRNPMLDSIFLSRT